MVRMNENGGHFSKDREIVFKLGPGGEYVSEFSAAAGNRTGEGDRVLHRVLGTIAEMMEAIFCPAYAVESSLLKEPNQIINKKLEHKQELDNGITDDREEPTDNAAADAVAAGSGKVSDEQMLFGDDWGISRATGDKPKHRVRTSRRVTKKKITFSQGREGTLFEIDSLRSSVA